MLAWSGCGQDEGGSHIAVQMLLEVGEICGEFVHCGSLLGGRGPAECHCLEPKTKI